MSNTILDIPDIIQDIIKRNIDVATKVVENMYEGLLTSPMVVIVGDNPVPDPLGRGLTQMETPVLVGCWHQTDGEADALRSDVVDVFTNNDINPLDKDSNSYGVKHILITDFDSEDVRTDAGLKFNRIVELNVLWYLTY